MIDEGSVSTQFRHKDIIAQTLRGAQISGISGQSDFKARMIFHSAFAPPVIGAPA